MFSTVSLEGATDTWKYSLCFYSNLCSLVDLGLALAISCEVYRAPCVARLPFTRVRARLIQKTLRLLRLSFRCGPTTVQHAELFLLQGHHLFLTVKLDDQRHD